VCVCVCVCVCVQTTLATCRAPATTIRSPTVVTRKEPRREPAQPPDPLGCLRSRAAHNRPDSRTTTRDTSTSDVILMTSSALIPTSSSVNHRGGCSSHFEDPTSLVGDQRRCRVYELLLLTFYDGRSVTFLVSCLCWGCMTVKAKTTRRSFPRVNLSRVA